MGDYILVRQQNVFTGIACPVGRISRSPYVLFGDGTRIGVLLFDEPAASYGALGYRMGVRAYWQVAVTARRQYHQRLPARNSSEEIAVLPKGPLPNTQGVPPASPWEILAHVIRFLLTDILLASLLLRDSFVS